jgi:hypothetical protein
MIHQFRPQDQPAQTERYSEVWFDALFRALDRLHDDVSQGRLSSVLALAPAEMVGWLEDIIYTARETIREIQAAEAGRMQ